jgi:superfamily I DNA/RNA helicase
LLHRQDSQEGRYAELETAVDSLLAQGFKPEHIVILDYSGNNEHLASLKGIAKCNAYGWTSMPRRGVIRYSTVRKFKGMESPAVVLYNVSGQIERDDPLFYVASTRPKINLTILATQDAMMSISKLLST